MLTREMVELAAAVGERSSARAQIEQAQIVLRAAHERHEAAKARVLHAHEALEATLGSYGRAEVEMTIADEARALRAGRATLTDWNSDADELLRFTPVRETMPAPAPDTEPDGWQSDGSEFAPHDNAPIGVALTPTGEALAAAFADPSSSQIPPALEAACVGDGEIK